MFYFKLLFKLSILKTIYYSLRFKGRIFVGKKASLKISRKAKFEFIDKRSSIYIGVYFDTNDPTSVILHEGAVFRVGKSVWIHKGCKVIVRKNAFLEIQQGSFLNERSILDSRVSVKIGAKVAIGWQAIITDSDHHNIYTKGQLVNRPSGISISDNVWIGARVTILKNVNINENIVVSAGSIVSKALDNKNCIYGGNPIKILKENVTWD